MISGEADTLRQALGWEHIPQEISHKDQDSMRLFERMGTALENFSLPEETGMGNLDVVLLTLESSGYPVFLKKFFGGKEPVNTYTYTKAYETSDAKKLGRMQDAIREAIRAYWQDKLVELNKSRLMPVKRAENRKVS
jgi:hypothetical protein